MIPHLFFYQLVLLGLLWLFFMPHAAWPSQGTAIPRRPVEPILPPRKRSSDSKPFPGLTRKPHCEACAQAASRAAPAGSLRPTAPHRLPARTPPCSGHFAPFLSPSQLCVSGVDGPWQHPRQRPSQWRSLAAAVLSQVSRLLPGDPGQTVPRLTLLVKSQQGNFHCYR